MLFGFFLVLVFGYLAHIIAINKVEAQTSAYLDRVLDGLLMLAAGWSNGTFGAVLSGKKDKEP